MAHDRPTTHYRDFTMPEGWRWLNVAGQQTFETQGSDGAPRSGWSAFAIDPSDKEFPYDGDVTGAILRGTAIEVTISVEDQAPPLNWMNGAFHADGGTYGSNGVRMANILESAK